MSHSLSLSAPRLLAITQDIGCALRAQRIAIFAALGFSLVALVGLNARIWPTLRLTQVVPAYMLLFPVLTGLLSARRNSFPPAGGEMSPNKVSPSVRWWTPQLVCIVISVVGGAFLPCVLLALHADALPGSAWYGIDTNLWPTLALPTGKWYSGGVNLTVALLATPLTIALAALTRSRWVTALLIVGAFILGAELLPKAINRQFSQFGIYDIIGQITPSRANPLALTLAIFVPLGLMVREAYSPSRRLVPLRAALGGIIRIALFTTLTLAIIGSVRLAPVPLPSLLKRVESAARLPALSLMTTGANEVREIISVGSKRLGSDQEITRDAQYSLGSNTKAMTATLIAMLIEEEKLSWETKILDLFPEWKQTARSEYAEVTVSDLLHHRAGIQPYTYVPGAQWKEDVETLTGPAERQRLEFCRRALHRAPVTIPRTTYFYSNASYAIAGTIIEKLTGLTWEAAIQSRLFAPLGISATFDWPATNDPNQPWGHRQTDKGVEPHDPHDPHDNYHLPLCFTPAGGAAMSLADYAKFLQLHLRGLAGKDGLLKAESIKRLHSPIGGHAAGWGVSIVGGEPVSGHSGSGGTFYVLAHIWPQRQLALVAATNAGGSRASNACTEVLSRAVYYYGPNRHP